VGEGVGGDAGFFEVGGWDGGCEGCYGGEGGEVGLGDLGGGVRGGGEGVRGYVACCCYRGGWVCGVEG